MGNNNLVFNLLTKALNLAINPHFILPSKLDINSFSTLQLLWLHWTYQAHMFKTCTWNGQTHPWTSYASGHGHVCPTFQSHLIMIEKFGETTLKPKDPINVFNVALNGLDLKQNGSRIMKLGFSHHVYVDPNVFLNLNV